MDSLASLQSTIAKVERSRRRFDRKLWKLRRPGWCKPGSPFAKIFEDQEVLARKGTVVWGQIIQANSELFGAPENDWPGAPAAVIFSPKVEHDTQKRLAKLADNLINLKHGSEFQDLEQEHFGAMLADEETLFIDAPVPRSLDVGLRARCTYIYAARKHLEKRQLALTQIPLLIHADTQCAMAVPSKYWDDEFLGQWTRESAEHRATDIVDTSGYGAFKKTSLGMGSVLSFWGTPGLLLLIALGFLANEDYQYSRISEPTQIESRDVATMEDNSYVEFEANLLFAESFHYNDGKKLSGVLLVPVVGDESYLVSFPARGNPKIERRTERVVGRLRTRSWSGSHDVGPFLLDAVDHLRQLGRRAPSDLVIVVSEEHPGSPWFGISVFIFLTLVFWHVTRRIRRTFRFFRDDNDFAEFLLKRRRAQS